MYFFSGKEKCFGSYGNVLPSVRKGTSPFLGFFPLDAFSHRITHSRISLSLISVSTLLPKFKENVVLNAWSASSVPGNRKGPRLVWTSERWQLPKHKWCFQRKFKPSIFKMDKAKLGIFLFVAWVAQRIFIRF